MIAKNKDLIFNSLLNIVGKDNIKQDFSMANLTSIKTGGPATILVIPKDKGTFVDAVKYCIENKVPYIIFGNCSNVIITDQGIDKVVFLSSPALDYYSINDNEMIAGAGIKLSKLANHALSNSLAGLEFASGIPGTLGGAVIMNAGAYGGEMKDVISYVEFLDGDGKIQTLKNEAIKFGYRTSIFQKTCVTILESKIILEKGNKEDIKASMLDLNSRRKEKQPLEMPNAGSCFKRPLGKYAGKLIEDCGLKGYSIGGAQVSTKHCGFIVNKGNATSGDIIELIEHIKNTVLKETGVILEVEYKIVGEEKI